MLLTHKKHSISAIYPCMQKLFIPTLDKTLLKAWSRDFQDPDIVQKMIEGYRKITKCIISETWRESQYKISHRAHSTYFHPKEPQDTKQQTPKCPKCQQDKPTLLHSLWTCPLIQEYWEKVVDYIFQITQVYIDREPFFCLFNIIPTKGTPSSERQKRAAGTFVNNQE